MADPMRESFVAAFRAKWGWGFDPDLSGGQYDWWRVAWQAATAAERERCAGICERHAELARRIGPRYRGEEEGAAACAHKIRSTPADEEPRT